MSLELWSTVETYLNSQLVEVDEALTAALATSKAAGLPDIAVTPAAGKLLHLLARLSNARRILEIGTLGAYSTIWMARALLTRNDSPKLVTLECDPNHAGVARGNLLRAGLENIVEVRVGRAIETLPMLLGELPTRGPFDMFFIDADKQNNAAYFQWALRLARPGSLILIDNVVRKGDIIKPDSTDEAVQGTRRLLETMSQAQRDGRITATALQTVGSKNYDGLAFALVN